MSTESRPDESEIRAIVRRVVLRTLGQPGTAGEPAVSSPDLLPTPGKENVALTVSASAKPTLDLPKPAEAGGLTTSASSLGASRASRSGRANGTRRTVTENEINELAPGTTLEVPEGALITPLAREAADRRGITLRVLGPARPTAPGSTIPAPAAPGHEGQPAVASSAGTGPSIAIGADHGGFRLKEALKPYVAELGYSVLDCGTHSTEAVDYPDVAYSVARLVAEGRAKRGILIDGAGIGSCMAANKVPGVRAAMCYDQATAVNSREHNDANVLTLGAGLIGDSLARQIVKTWLDTEFGGGRHARRVDKIGQIERRFLKP